jgi:CheY-like chemotaxis protein
VVAFPSPTDIPTPALGRRLLLVEDEVELAEKLTELFTDEGYRVDVAPDGQSGLHLDLTRTYKVAVLDRGLPAIDGLDLLDRLCRNGVSTPIPVERHFSVYTRRRHQDHEEPGLTQ